MKNGSVQKKTENGRGIVFEGGEDGEMGWVAEGKGECAISRAVQERRHYVRVD